MRISVIVPTFRRPRQLASCLKALSAQRRRADEVVVIARPEDADAWVVSAEHGVAPTPVARGGVAAAYNAGLTAAAGDIVAFTDDDAAPSVDWLERLEQAYVTWPATAGVGGRDLLPNSPAKPARLVGRVQWFGRVIGNHHCGVGPARLVDVLKGVNMSFRRAAIGDLKFDEELAGTGAQVGVELDFCLALRRRGLSLLYDPAITVLHRPAPRMDGSREAFDAGRFTDSVENMTTITLRHLPAARRPIFLLYATLIGTRGEPGLIQSGRLVVAGDRHAWAKTRAAFAGRLRSFRSRSTR